MTTRTSTSTLSPRRRTCARATTPSRRATASASNASRVASFPPSPRRPPPSPDWSVLHLDCETATCATQRKPITGMPNVIVRCRIFELSLVEFSHHPQVSLELLKVIQRFPTLERYRNAFINLGISLFAFSEPGPAEKTKITEGVYFTLWDRWEVREGDITLQEFCQYFDDKYKLKVFLLSPSCCRDHIYQHRDRYHRSLRILPSLTEKVGSRSVPGRQHDLHADPRHRTRQTSP